MKITAAENSLIEAGFPDEIGTQLRALCIEGRKPAYIHVDEQSLVLAGGGDLSHYGMESPLSGAPAGQAAAYLEGLLPVGPNSFMLPFVEVRPSIYADIYFFPGGGVSGDWVLFLDATAIAHRLFELQQSSHELTLLRRQQTDLLARIRRSQDDLVTILNQLDLVTVMIDPDGSVGFLSETASRLLGVLPGEAVGMPWRDVLPLGADDLRRLERRLSGESGATGRFSVRTAPSVERARSFEADIRDSPRQAGQKILYLYDISDVHTLRRMLDGKARYEGMIGRSDAMQAVFQLIREVAPVDATVLIQGETGTGKELVAQAIHSASRRNAKPMLVMNCAGLSDSLINSQLFGHKKGAFTDAVADQQGYFEAAQGGTLLLDEIGDIPMNTQTRILRVLEQKEVIRVGETKARPIDVRILAATNKDLDQEVRQGRFRADLLYRIRVARVAVPALRERPDDIIPLVDAFLVDARAVTGKDVEGVDSEVLRALADYAWPGNVRELKNAIAFAMIRCRGAVIRLQDLPPEILDPASALTRVHLNEVDGEKARLLRALEESRGSRSEAARLLGIGRATFYRRMRSCMLDPDSLPHRARWSRT